MISGGVSEEKIGSRWLDFNQRPLGYEPFCILQTLGRDNPQGL